MLGKLTVFFSGGLLLISLWTPSAGALSVSGGRDCDDNAVMHCGALSTDELKQKHTGSGVVGIFNHFGISETEISNIGSTAQAGHVTRNGDVVVDGRVVATDAVTAGRQNMSGSTKVMAGGVAFYKRPVSVSFAQERLPAFVVMKDGQFSYAILASCGNPVSAKPVKPPVTKAPINIVKITKDTAGRQLPAVATNVFIFDVTCDGQTRTVTYNQSPMPAGNCIVGQIVTITERPVTGWQIMSSAAQSFTVAQGGVQAVFENQQIAPPQVQATVTPPPPAPAPQLAPQPAPAVQLPKTGAESAAGIGLVTAVASGFAHYWYKRRKV